MSNDFIGGFRSAAEMVYSTSSVPNGHTAQSIFATEQLFGDEFSESDSNSDIDYDDTTDGNRSGAPLVDGDGGAARGEELHGRYSTFSDRPSPQLRSSQMLRGGNDADDYGQPSRGRRSSRHRTHDDRRSLQRNDAASSSSGSAVAAAVTAIGGNSTNMTNAAASQQRRRYSKRQDDDRRNNSGAVTAISDAKLGFHWTPTQWSLNILPCATFEVMWHGTMSNFERADDNASNGAHKIDYTQFAISHEDFIGNCRRHGDKEYYACNNEMHRVIYCRLRDNSVNPILVRFEKVYNGFPFPICVKSDHAGLNNLQVVVPVYDDNNRITGERVEHVCAVLPAREHIEDVVVADFRRIMSDNSTTQFMKLDKDDLDLEYEILTLSGRKKQGRIAVDSTFYQIVEDVARDKYHDLNRHALAIRDIAKSGQSLVKRRDVDDNEEYQWYEHLPSESVTKIRDWVMEEIKAVTKIDSLSFRIFPLFGKAAWMMPDRWAFRDMMASRTFGLTARAIQTNSTIDTSTVEFKNLFLNAGLTLKIYYL